MPDSTMPSKVPAPPILTANFAGFDVLVMHEIGADERADDADREGDWCGHVGRQKQGDAGGNDG